MEWFEFKTTEDPLKADAPSKCSKCRLNLEIKTKISKIKIFKWNSKKFEVRSFEHFLSGFYQYDLKFSKK